MGFYRLYILSEITRRFEPSKEITAASDQAAIALAEEARANRSAELWTGARMVKEWKD
jgi:hypothetical protein